MGLTKNPFFRRSYTVELTPEHTLSSSAVSVASPDMTFPHSLPMASHIDTMALWQVLFILLRLSRTLSPTVRTEPTISARRRTGSSSGVTGMLSMNAYPSRNGKCMGDFMSCIVMNAVRNTNEKFTASPRNGSISETKAPMPMARVNAIRLARFDRGLTERSLPSIIRAMMTTNTPTSALFWPNTAVYTPTNRHSARKNRLFPISVLAFMIPAPGGAISRCHIPG